MNNVFMVTQRNSKTEVLRIIWFRWQVKCPTFKYYT